MGEYHDFAMIVQVEPEYRRGDWERVLRSASPPPGISMTVRNPHLLFFVVNADNEFFAIGMVEDWLTAISRCLLPPFALSFNAQCSEAI